MKSPFLLAGVLAFALAGGALLPGCGGSSGGPATSAPNLSFTRAKNVQFIDFPELSGILRLNYEDRNAPSVRATGTLQVVDVPDFTPSTEPRVGFSVGLPPGTYIVRGSVLDGTNGFDLDVDVTGSYPGGPPFRLTGQLRRQRPDLYQRPISNRQQRVARAPVARHRWNHKRRNHNGYNNGRNYHRLEQQQATRTAGTTTAGTTTAGHHNGGHHNGRHDNGWRTWTTTAGTTTAGTTTAGTTTAATTAGTTTAATTGGTTAGATAGATTAGMGTAGDTTAGATTAGSTLTGGTSRPAACVVKLLCNSRPIRTI